MFVKLLFLPPFPAARPVQERLGHPGRVHRPRGSDFVNVNEEKSLSAEKKLKEESLFNFLPIRDLTRKPPLA